MRLPVLISPCFSPWPRLSAEAADLFDSSSRSFVVHVRSTAATGWYPTYNSSLQLLSPPTAGGQSLSLSLSLSLSDSNFLSCQGYLEVGSGKSITKALPSTTTIVISHHGWEGFHRRSGERMSGLDYETARLAYKESIFLFVDRRKFAPGHIWYL